MSEKSLLKLFNKCVALLDNEKAFGRIKAKSAVRSNALQSIIGDFRKARNDAISGYRLQSLATAKEEKGADVPVKVFTRDERKFLRNALKNPEAETSKIGMQVFLYPAFARAAIKDMGVLRQRAMDELLFALKADTEDVEKRYPRYVPKAA